MAYYVSDIEQTSGLGCTMGGLTHCTIDTAGNVNPCVFVPISFGSILHEELPVIMDQMRSVINEPIHNGCASELLQHVYATDSVLQDRTTVKYADVSEQWETRLKKKKVNSTRTNSMH
jgi:hypothetical protein